MSSISGLNSLSSMAASPLPLVSATTQGASGATTSGGSSSTGLDSVDSLGTTFMSLLAQELQNQDPTQPMDSTDMVGQMISLNQLDQLASIDQLLDTQFGGTASTTATSGGTPQPTNPGLATQAGMNAAIQAALQNSNPSSMANSQSTPPVSLPAL